MHDSSEIVIAQHAEHKQGTLGSYVTGFILSIVLTIIPFVVVINEMLKGWSLLWLLVGFAVLQLLVQLIFFLHLSHESKPRWNLTAFAFMLIFLVIIVVGSLWVMHHLDYNMMPAHQMNDHMLEESQKGF